ncbi:hypothetical protein ACFO1B_36260 [Dactylosporangium siamense]|uniref:Uncharacterized protein n=1 Tax=Dactylosporangium siamense TaxID=685454 RepID=A0A919UBU8_9ACTN|nr:hypothetical protein [Dactylosporangium siamense]GIG46031.1 hypothetical protein Dsi01nite_040720 [Dactylosporangium siamense]
MITARVRAAAWVGLQLGILAALWLTVAGFLTAAVWPRRDRGGVT